MVSRVIKAPRAYGKTTQLVIESANTGYTIVSRGDVGYVKGIGKRMGLTLPEPITHRKFIEGDYDKYKIKGFLIDDGDLLIKVMTSIPIKTITVCEYPYSDFSKNK